MENHKVSILFKDQNTDFEFNYLNANLAKIPKIFGINYEYEYFTDLELKIKIDDQIAMDSEEITCFLLEEGFHEINFRIELDKKYYIYFKGIHIKNNEYDGDDQCGGFFKSIALEFENIGDKKRIDYFPDFVGIIFRDELSEDKIELLEDGKIVYMCYEDLEKIYFVDIHKDGDKEEEEKNGYSLGSFCEVTNLGDDEMKKIKKLCDLLTKTQKLIGTDVYPGGSYEIYINDAGFIDKTGERYYSMGRERISNSEFLHISYTYNNNEIVMLGKYIDKTIDYLQRSLTN